MLSVPASRSGSIAAPASSSRRERAAPASAPVHAAPDAAGLERQREVFGDGQVRKQRRLLVDGGDPERARERRRHVWHDAPGHGERAGIGLLGAGHDLDQRRLAGAVLADERVHLARLQVERHVAERADAFERFGDGRRGEQDVRQAAG